MRTPYEVFLEQEVANLRRELARVTVGDRITDAYGHTYLAPAHGQSLSPTEAQLRYEIKQLQEQVHALISHTPTSYALNLPANELIMEPLVPVVRLAVQGGYEGVRDDSGYHIWVKDRATREQFSVGYYMTNPERLDAKDITALMANTVEKAVYQLAEVLKCEK